MDLKKKITEMYEQKISKNEIFTYILEYIKIIDKTENSNYTEQMRKFFENITIDDFMKNLHNFFIIQPPFESIGMVELMKAMEYTKTPFEYEVFDPVEGKKVDGTIAVGYHYFLKLNHIAKDKISYRGIGPYSAKTSQPLGGKSRKGGQRLGEMEMWAVIAHGAEKNLNEFISTKSDSIKMRNKYISDKIGNTELLLESDDDAVSQSLRLLQTNLKTLGLDYFLHEDDDKKIVSPPVQPEQTKTIKDLKDLEIVTIKEGDINVK
jgi:DNA-directed RNA polymerase subunit beta